MVQVILGNKGSGKTLKLISMTNDALQSEKGNIFFIDSHNRHMYDLHRDIRFVNATEYGVDSAEMFYGMLCGMMSCPTNWLETLHSLQDKTLHLTVFWIHSSTTWLFSRPKR